MATKKLEKLVDDYYDRLFRAALFMTGEPDVAEELVQETYAAAFESIDSFEGRSAKYTWLYGILLNKFRSWLRTKKKIVSLQKRAEIGDFANLAELLESEEPSVEEEITRREQARAVRIAINELPAHHRAVLALRYLEDKSYEEIAEDLDCSLGTVKSRIHYALEKISRKLKTRIEWKD
ncbi:MAG: RNA polymerase sigma factor [Candidatus Brocadiia bacterium]